MTEKELIGKVHSAVYHQCQRRGYAAPVDVLMLPVGGFYTIDAETAKRVADAIAPRVIVPMHYRHGSHGYDVIATVEDFLRLYPADEVHCLDGSSFELTPDAPRGVIVPKFMG